ncbi:MAG: Uma2 family endonuclease, partial [Gammaproteobacteria bacterium]|nr:Uma2 family endonuclease [Gammaproteobacteria bacterium]
MDAFHRMVETGILAADARVELIHGEMLDMAPIGNKHAAIVNRLNMHLAQACAGSAIVAIQQSLRLDRHSEPQPDIAVLKPRTDFYEARHAAAEDVLLLVEVS